MKNHTTYEIKTFLASLTENLEDTKSDQIGGTEVDNPRAEIDNSMRDISTMYSLWACKTKGPIVPRVLIVDDDPESTKILQVCLERLGCQLTVVASASEALDMLTSRPYDLVFLDWIMPEVTGGQTLVRVEKLLNGLDPILDYPWSILRLPVIIYSGIDNQVGPPDCKHFKVIDQWKKTASFSQLMDKSSQVVIQLKSKLSSQGPKNPPPFAFLSEAQTNDLYNNGETKVKRVLLVESNVALREITAAHLEEKGFSVVPATNAAEAFNLVQNQAKDWFALIADYNLPEVSGDQFIRKFSTMNFKRPEKIILIASDIPSEPVCTDLEENFGVLILVKPVSDLEPFELLAI